jgi:hypothetical protein
MFSRLQCVDNAAACLRVFIACVASLAAASAFASANKGDIVVANVHGDARVTMAGATSPLYVGAILQLPATIRTGRDGSLELRQGPTTVAAAANTELEIPQSAAEGGLIERIVQIRGNAFYSVGKRERTKLRVETPYLVAVIKGTQFNVASQEESTTIALFEGQLEIRATDESDVIDLRAGQIAIRNRGEPSIRTLEMNATADARAKSAGSLAAAAGSASPDTEQTARLAVSTGVVDDSPTVANVASNDFGAQPAADVGGGAASPGSVDTASSTAGVSSTGPSMGLGASVDLGANISSAGASLEAGVSVPGTSAGVDVGVSIAGGSASVDTSVAAGGIGVDAGVSIGGSTNVSADIGVGSLANTGIAATAGADGIDAAVTANVGGVGAAVSIDVGTTSPSLGVDAGANVGNLVGTNVTVDAGLGSAPLAVDAGIDVGGTTVGATIDTSSTVAAGVNVGNVVGVDIDLASGTIDVNVGGNDTGGGLVGGIVGGLFGGRKGR